MRKIKIKNNRIITTALCLIFLIVIVVLCGSGYLKKDTIYIKAIIRKTIYASSSPEIPEGFAVAPKSDASSITSLIKKMHRTQEFADYEEQKLRSAISLKYQGNVYSASGENVYYMAYDGGAYRNHGLMSESRMVGEQIGEGLNTELTDLNNPMLDAGETVMTVYEIVGVDSVCAVAVTFEGGEGYYLYVDDDYFYVEDDGYYHLDDDSWESGALLENLSKMGINEDAYAYVEMVTSNRAFRIFCPDFPMEYLIENIFSREVQMYDGETEEGQNAMIGAKVTGLAVHISSNLTGGHLWLYFYDNGNVKILAGNEEASGTPMLSLVLDMEDEDLSIGTDLINYANENYELMILYGAEKD